MREKIITKKEGKTAIIEFHNPPENYFDNVLLKEFYEELIQIRKDDSIRVLVLTGGLKDVFILHYNVSDLLEYGQQQKKLSSSQADRAGRIMYWLSKKVDQSPWFDKFIIRSMKRKTPAEKGIYYWVRCLHILDTMPKPVIAAINGVCLGGGCEMSLCADFRYMAKGEKYQIGLPEVLIGIMPGGTGTPIRLPKIVGEAKALEMIMTGTTYQAEEAERIGLIHKAIDPEQLMTEVMDLANRLAAYSPVALQNIRKVIRLGSRYDYHQGRKVDAAASMAVMGSMDAKEGMRRFVEDIVSKYKGLDLEQRISDADKMRAGKLFEFLGE